MKKLLKDVLDIVLAIVLVTIGFSLVILSIGWSNYYVKTHWQVKECRTTIWGHYLCQ